MFTFTKLQEPDLNLLFNWLTTPHVQKFWDPGVIWTKKLVAEKYASYIEGYKIIDGIKKTIHAYTFAYARQAIGYIQYYNVADFPRDSLVPNLPLNTAALDFFLGEPIMLGKGLGSAVLKEFIANYCYPQYSHVFVDPDINNHAAIKTYLNAGFKEIHRNFKEIWLLH